jgi:signal transduction histidine kinase
VRTRLVAILVSLMTAGLLAFGIPLAWTLASSVQREVYVDRLADAARLASLVRQGSSGGDLRAVTADLVRYEEVYGVRGAVLDRLGRPLATSTTPPDLAAPATAEAVRTALNGRRAEPPPTLPPWSDLLLVVTEPVVQGGDVTGVVVTASPTAGMHDEVLRSWAALAVVMAAALAASVVLSVRLAGWVLHPVRVLDDAAHAVGVGRLGTRVPEGGGPPELRRLARAFNGMADGVEALVRQQRAFVADASHQLRNPMSALLLRLEEARLTLAPDDAARLDATREEAVRLGAVLDELLELARAENADAAPVPVDAAALLADRAGAWAVVARRRGVRLEVDAPAELRVLASPPGLGSAVDALVDNAVKFSPDGATVVLRGRAAGPGAEVVLSVLDEGLGLEPDELSRAVDRFWRSPRHTNVEGSGLGLAIATALVERWGGSLEMRRAGTGGLEASLRLRPAPGPGGRPRPGGRSGPDGAVVRQRPPVQVHRRREDRRPPVERPGQRDGGGDLAPALEQQPGEGLGQSGVGVGPHDEDVRYREGVDRGGEPVLLGGDRGRPVDGEPGLPQDADRLDDRHEGQWQLAGQLRDRGGGQPA